MSVRLLTGELAAAIDALPRREAIVVIVLTCWFGLTQLEVAEVLEVSRARVFQLRQRAIERLRCFLAQDVAA